MSAPAAGRSAAEAAESDMNRSQDGHGCMQVACTTPFSAVTTAVRSLQETKVQAVPQQV